MSSEQRRRRNMAKVSHLTKHLLDFYKAYHIDYWRYKLFLLQNIISYYDSVKEFLHASLGDVDDENFRRMLKVEIHFIYFQIVEALFELIFALENQDDLYLWYNLTVSDWRKNYTRIREEIAKGQIHFLDRIVKIKEVTLPLIQYLFYFIYDSGLAGNDKIKNYDVIKRALVIFAKDFSDRDDYNAYKHSMRLYQSPVKLGIVPDGSSDLELIAQASDTLTYLHIDQKGRLVETIKAFDVKRDFNMSVLCSNMIHNVIVSRKRFFYKTNELLYNFNDVNLQMLNYSDTTFMRFSFSAE